MDGGSLPRHSPQHPDHIVPGKRPLAATVLDSHPHKPLVDGHFGRGGAGGNPHTGPDPPSTPWSEGIVPRHKRPAVATAVATLPDDLLERDIGFRRGFRSATLTADPRCRGRRTRYYMRFHRLSRVLARAAANW